MRPTNAPQWNDVGALVASSRNLSSNVRLPEQNNKTQSNDEYTFVSARLSPLFANLNAIATPLNY
jgi:hypothetical protein